MEIGIELMMIVMITWEPKSRYINISRLNLPKSNETSLQTRRQQRDIIGLTVNTKHRVV